MFLSFSGGGGGGGRTINKLIMNLFRIDKRDSSFPSPTLAPLYSPQQKIPSPEDLWGERGGG